MQKSILVTSYDKWGSLSAQPWVTLAYSGCKAICFSTFRTKLHFKRPFLETSLFQEAPALNSSLPIQVQSAGNYPFQSAKIFQTSFVVPVIKVCLGFLQPLTFLAPHFTYFIKKRIPCKITKRIFHLFVLYLGEV